MPYLTETDQKDTDETNPFFKLPFIPGGFALSNGTLPEFAILNISDIRGEFVEAAYFFDKFGEYGAELLRRV